MKQIQTFAEAAEILDEFSGVLDEQTYDDKKRADWDPPDDAEFCITITSGMEGKVMQAINFFVAAFKEKKTDASQ